MAERAQTPSTFQRNHPKSSPDSKVDPSSAEACTVATEEESVEKSSERESDMFRRVQKVVKAWGLKEKTSSVPESATHYVIPDALEVKGNPRIAEGNMGLMLTENSFKPIDTYESAPLLLNDVLLVRRHS
jgi:hypothetical protein